jgi:dUTP pyrophosphatase
MTTTYNMDTIIFSKIDPDGPGITRAHETDAGYDLYSAMDITLSPKACAKIRTNVKVKLPRGTFGKLFDRSSMASKSLLTSGGVIDQGYTGEIVCIISNLGNEPYTIKVNDKITQMVLIRYSNATITEVQPDEFSELTLTSDRGQKGFGSSGI